jgi:hypothetical protein
MDARFQLSLDFHLGHAYVGFWPIAALEALVD